MRWIKNRNSFLNEAKIRDVILLKQKEVIIEVWGERYLDFETIEPTDNIKQGKWKLSEEDKIEALSVFFNADLEKVYDFFGSLPDEFAKLIKESIDFNLLGDEKWLKILNEFDIKRPTINQISTLSENIFRKISVSETKADEIMIRDESGRPVMGEDGRPLKRKREEGEIIFSKNLVNINSMVDDFNGLYPDKKIDSAKFSSGEIMKVISASKEDFGGDKYQIEVDVYGKDLFLRIDHNPKDILNISISRFYGSCQHLYRGSYREKVIANVFDPNTIPAFLVFDSPILDKDDVMISEQLPLSRMMVRNIYNFENPSDPQIYFDRAYPHRMDRFMEEIIEKYSGNKMTASEDDTYLFAPDLPSDISVDSPYMDRLGLKKALTIGVNSRSITFNLDQNWNKYIISPKAKIEEIVIETEALPQNFFELNLNLKNILIRYIDIKNLTIFNKIGSNSWTFEKCIISRDAINGFTDTQKDIKFLHLINCDISEFDLTNFKGLEELSLIWLYDFELDDLKKFITSLNPKRGFKLNLSSDLISDKEYINTLKNSGIIIKDYEKEIIKKRKLK